MKVVLAEACARPDESGVYVRTEPMDPLNLGYLGAVAQRDGYDVKIIQQRRENLEGLADRIIFEKPDLVGFTTMTWNFHQTKRLAAEVKRRTGAVNIFWGYHVSAIHEDEITVEIDQPIDYVVIGEGETTFSKLMDCVKNGKDPSQIEGMAFRKNGKLVITKPRERIRDLDSLPWPIRSKDLMQYKIPLFSPAMSQQRSQAQVTYSRGCPNHCSFCASNAIWGCRVFHRDAKNVLDEIEYLQKEFDVNSVFFPDLTFNLIEKKVYELCDGIKSRGMKFGWHGMFKPIANERLFQAVKEAGCGRVGFGIESPFDDILESEGKNQRTKSVREAIQITDSCGILIRAYLIMGFPGERFADYDDYVNRFTSSLREYASAGVDDLRLNFLAPFPGTSVYRQCKEKDLFLTQDFDKFSHEEYLLIRHTLSSEELLRAKATIFRGFFESPEYVAHVKDKIRRFPELRDSYTGFFGFLKQRGISVNA